MDSQIDFQYSCEKNIEGQSKSAEEMVKLRDKYESAIINDNYDAFESKCYFFKGELNVVSSSVFQCEFDFSGNKLVDMWDLTQDAQLLSHTVVNTDDGGAIIFVWLKDDEDPKAVVDSFDEITSGDKGDIFVQYCFLKCENTFFSEKWWNNLDQKEQIKRYANTLYYEGGKFSAGSKKLVSWKFA